MKKSIVFIAAATFLIGSATTALANGTYYEYSVFGGPGSENDVTCYGNDIYYGGGASVYRTTVSIGDMTYVNDHTGSANYQARSFTTPTAITLTGAPGTLNIASVGEMWVDDNYLYTTGGGSNNLNGSQVYSFNKSSGAYVSTVVTGGGITNPGFTTTASLLSYGGGKWWAGNEGRDVYSSTGGAWNYEFTWNDMTGGHGDGMEYVNGHMFVSDMTSNHIAMWDYDGSAWSQTEIYDYVELGSGNKDVEGMGFGALGHFWAGSGSAIYELGGGTITEVVTPTGIPAPGAILLGSIGVSLVGWLRRRRSL